MPADIVPLFLNPAAGRGRAARRLPAIRDLLGQSGIEIAVQESRSVGDLEARVRYSVENGTTRLIVAGGDGSIHEAVNGLMPPARPVALGVIPIGTGNDFAKACAIPLDWREAARQLAARLAAATPPRPIDLGRMNGRYFANGAGIGLDAKVTRIARSIRLPIGDIVYLLAILRCMVDGIASPSLTIAGDVTRPDQPLTLANVSNGAWIGGMFHIAPMAVNDDGRLDLIVAAPVTRRRIARLLPLLMRGRHLDEAEISHASVRHLTVTAAAPVPSHLDGEVQALQTHFEIDVLPAALALL